jgi:hypothetical protein
MPWLPGRHPKGADHLCTTTPLKTQCGLLLDGQNFLDTSPTGSGRVEGIGSGYEPLIWIAKGNWGRWTAACHGDRRRSQKNLR